MYGGKKVVVTGLGVVSSLGSKVDLFWANLFQGKSGIQRIANVDPLYDTIPCKIAGTVQDEEIKWEIEKFKIHSLPRFVQFAVISAQHAISDAGLADIETRSKIAHKIGVSIGSGMSTLDEIYNGYNTILHRGSRKLSPYFIPRILSNMAASHVSIKFGFSGPQLSASTACATGLHAIGDAFRTIAYGDAEVMIAGATEAAINPLSLAGFCQAKALTTISNEAPTLGSRPFDKNRSGFVIGEGAAILVLESKESAIRRGAHIYAEIAGYGTSSDAYHITASHPDGEGAYLAMNKAIIDAKILPPSIDYVNAHATSTLIGDEAEVKGLQRLFMDYKDLGEKEVYISSIKGHIGHLLGASGAIEALSTVKSISEQAIPANLNLESCQFDADTRFSFVRRPVFTSIKYALSNSFGFGGVNGSLCFKQSEGME